jgi:hypothetical protein
MSEGFADRRLDQPYGLIGSDLLIPQILMITSAPSRANAKATAPSVQFGGKPRAGWLARSRERTHLGSGYPWRSVCLYVGQHLSDRTPA